MLKFIVFDYNGVLANDLWIHAEAYYRTGLDLGFPVTREKIAPYLSTSPEEKRVLIFGDISDETWSRVKERHAENYRKIAGENDLLFPDTEAVLKSLMERYSVGVLSNTRRWYFDQFFPPHLAERLAGTVFFEDMRIPKPSPEAYLALLDRLGIEPEESCYVGDAVSDIRMAKDAGVLIYAVTTGHHSEEQLRTGGADRVFPNLTALGNYLNNGAPGS